MTPRAFRSMAASLALALALTLAVATQPALGLDSASSASSTAKVLAEAQAELEAYAESRAQAQAQAQAQSDSASQDTLRDSLRARLRTNLDVDLDQAQTATPLDANLPHACKGVPEGGAPNIRTDIYYVWEYTRDGTTRYMAHGAPNTDRDWTERELTPWLRNREFDTNDRANAVVHWRFESLGGGEYRVVSGYSGQWIMLYHDTSRTWDYLLATTGEHTTLTVSSCDRDGRVSVSVANLQDGYIRYHREAWQFAVTAQQWEETMTTKCCDSCPSGWTRTEEVTMACLVCDKEKCWRLGGPNEYQKTPVKFRLFESPQFYAPDVKSGPAQTVAADPALKYIAAAGLLVEKGITIISNNLNYGSWTVVAGQVVNKFGNLAKVASVGLGVLGMALSIAIDMTQPTIQEQLAQLEQKIMTAVGNLVSDSIVGNAVNQASNMLKTSRFSLNKNLRCAKKTAFVQNDAEAIDDTADLIKGVAANINTALDMIRPAGISEPGVDRGWYLANPTITNTDTNVKLIQQGYLLFSSGVLDLVTALSEAVILDSIAHPGLSCENIIADVGLAVHAERQAWFMEQMASFLLNRRLNQLRNDKNPGTYTGWTARDGFLGKDVYYTGDDGNRGTGDYILALRKQEITWDMNTYAYPFASIKRALDQVVANTLAQCRSLRSDAALKASYVECAKFNGVGCACAGCGC